MIGRFLLGAGLGGLVGTGMLALVSINVPLHRAADATPAEPATAPATTSATATTTATTTATPSQPAPLAKPLDASPAAEPSVDGTASQPVPVTPQAKPGAAPSVAAAPAPAGALASRVDAEALAPLGRDEAASPITAGADGGADLLPVPHAKPGAAPGNPAAEVKPLAPETPAAAPHVAPTAPPALHDGASALPGTAIQAPADLPAPRPGSVAPAAVVTEKAPAETLPEFAALAPEPPPLTPEEEALLRRIAEEGPDALGAPLDPAVNAADAAPKAGATAEAAPGTTGPDVEGKARSTLPSAPALTMRGAEQNAAPAPVGRLPRIGDQQPLLAADSAAPAPNLELPPISRFARSFDNAAAKPVFAIILIDSGEADLDREALAALPFPVSFAIDPQAKDAALRAKIYRAAGQEVVMLATGLPKGATAQDVEVAFGVMGDALPEAVAVMDVSERRFQADRPLATLVIAAIEGQGRGLITWNEGLNAADQVARRADLPAAVIFRNLDAAGEAGPVIRRYLDRAAFKAAQENRVIVLGHTRPDTVAALLEWTVEGRAATVALAPVTAVMSVD